MPPVPMGWASRNTGATGTKVVDIADTNGGNAARTALFQVNGQKAAKVSFPPTGSWTTPGTVSVEVSLAKGSSNTLTFSNSPAWTLDFDAIEVCPLPGAKRRPGGRTAVEPLPRHQQHHPQRHRRTAAGLPRR
ncbi:carbohydrate-binding protein [Streptomyces dysideae]|nr:hypothetical protein [Streptomyces dysideae]